MNKSAEVFFAEKICDCVYRKNWSDTRLYMEANKFEENFSLRQFQNWKSAKALPKLRSVVAMAEALEMPELINYRVEAEIAQFRQQKSRQC